MSASAAPDFEEPPSPTSDGSCPQQDGSPGALPVNLKPSRAWPRAGLPWQRFSSSQAPPCKSDAALLGQFVTTKVTA